MSTPAKRPRRFPRTLLARELGVVLLIISGLAGAAAWWDLEQARDAIESTEKARLLAVAASHARQIDGSAMAQAIAEHDAISVRAAGALPDALGRIQESLRVGAEANGLNAPMFTLSQDPAQRILIASEPDRFRAGAMHLGVVSDGKLVWGTDYDYHPGMSQALHGKVATAVDIYEYNQRSYLSAYAPIFDDEGAVVGVVQADATVDAALAALPSRLWPRLGVSAGGLVLLMLGLVLVNRGWRVSLSGLQHAMERLAGGDVHSRIPVAGPWHVAELARAAERMRRSISRDLAQQKRSEANLAQTVETTEAEVEKAKDEARLAAEVRTEFLSSASEEIHALLNDIIGVGNILRDQSRDGESRENAEVVLEGGRSLLQIFNNSLGFAKIEADRVNESKDFDPVVVVEETLELFAQRAFDKDVKLLFDVGPAVPRVVDGNPGWMHNVLLNLVNDALKWTDEGHVIVRVRAFNEEVASATSFYLEVEDTGRKVIQGVADDVFDLVNAHDAGPRRDAGGPLMDITRRIIEQLGGSVGFQDQPDGANTFWFTVRLTSSVEGGPIDEQAYMIKQVWPEHMRGSIVPDFAAHASASAASDYEEELEYAPPDDDLEEEVLTLVVDDEVEPEEHRGRQRRVLVAEDNPVSQKVMAHLLGNLGYDFEIVANGREVLDALARASFDLVLMDCMMPEMDGFETTAEIRRGEDPSQTTPIIAFTANVVNGMRERCLMAGMDAYLPKPVDPDVLAKILEQWIGRSSAA